MVRKGLLLLRELHHWRYLISRENACHLFLGKILFLGDLALAVPAFHVHAVDPYLLLEQKDKGGKCLCKGNFQPKSEKSQRVLTAKEKERKNPSQSAFSTPSICQLLPLL